jgi:phosphatidylserine/phosphatidylglycerophosphate/cardiolipin synthase-like enzyme
MDALKVLFLEDGAQTAASVASWLAGMIASARVSLDLAIYDFHLEGEAADILVGALRERQAAGVRLRIVYNQPSALPSEGVAEPARPTETAAFLAAQGLPARPIGDTHGSHLMHHKYLLVDAGTPGARLWTGSANLTLAAFTRQENNLLDIASPALVDAYAADFEELWTTGDITASGARDGKSAMVRYAGQDALVEVRFAPGMGRAIDLEVADRISAARREVTIASVVLTSGHILGALRDVARRGLSVSGIVDGQMKSILAYWRRSPQSTWKADAFEELARYGAIHEKQSARTWPAGPHDYMHDKVIVVDDTVITGSYNLSVNAQSNAENILFIESPALALAYRAHVGRLVQRYPAAI